VAADVVYVVDGGLAMYNLGLLALGATEPAHIGYGTGTTAAVATNTALETARDEARTDGTSSAETTTTTGDTYQVTGVIACATSSAAIAEVALFDAATAGNMFLRATHDVINLNVADSIAYTIKSVLNQA